MKDIKMGSGLLKKLSWVCILGMFSAVTMAEEAKVAKEEVVQEDAVKQTEPAKEETAKQAESTKKSAHGTSSKDKLDDDPTNVVTQLAVSYTDQAKFTGSLALDQVRKINVTTNSDASEWRIGGSWLFDFGIVNFSFGRNEFDDGSHQNNYSVGTFVPLSVFGFAPGGWQIFPSAGFSYNDGEIICDPNVEDCDDNLPLLDPNDPTGFVLAPQSSSGGYLGAFALKPLSDRWTLVTFGFGFLGSDDYSGYSVGGGTGFKIDEHQSITAFAYATDNTYGDEQLVGIQYRYQFD